MPFWNRRLLIKPGMTGWAQVHCGYAADITASVREARVRLLVPAPPQPGGGPRDLRPDAADPPRDPRAGARWGAAPASRIETSRRAVKVAALITCAAAACGLVLLLTGEGEQAESPAASRTAPPVRPTPPASYHVPRGAIRVSTSRQLHAALASVARRTIVLAGGTYESRGPVLEPARPPHLRALSRGRAVLRAGLSLGGNAGAARRTGPGRRRGHRRRAADRRRRRDRRSGAPATRSAYPGQVTLRGNGDHSRGLVVRATAGRLQVCAPRRARVHGLRHLRRRERAQAGPKLRHPFRLAERGRCRHHTLGSANPRTAPPRPAYGSATPARSVKHVRARWCAWTGLWTGNGDDRGTSSMRSTSTRHRRVSTWSTTRARARFRRLHIGRDVRIGLIGGMGGPRHRMASGQRASTT